MKDTLRRLLACTLAGALAGFPHTVFASGHGPVFGLTTPTNAAGGWALDLGFMGRAGDDDNGAMSRAMLTYGFTEDFQLSVSLPLVFASAPFSPARGTAMMPGTGDFEAIGAWRFHRQGTAVGTRVESTAYGGLIVPGPQKPAGMAHAVSVSMEKLEGVRSAKVSLNAGRAVIELEPGNTVTLTQVLERVRRNGFTPQGALVTARARVAARGDALRLEVVGKLAVRFESRADASKIPRLGGEPGEAIGPAVELVGRSVVCDWIL